MSILVNRETRLIIQGITGRYGNFYSQKFLDYGTHIVAGVTPGKGGVSIHEIPVFDTVAEALQEYQADASIIFAPGPVAKDAILEAVDSGIKLILCIVDGLPVRDVMVVKRRLRESQTILLGPNTPGIITPGEFLAGFMPAHAFKPGNVGIASRSGTLTYQTADLLSKEGVGQSTALGIGGDPIVGFGFIDALSSFESDPATKLILLIGEIGGTQEEQAAAFIKNKVTKPVIAFIGGRLAPPGSKMGHAGAIVNEGRVGNYASKLAAFEAVGVPVAKLLSEIPGLVKKSLVKGF